MHTFEEMGGEYMRTMRSLAIAVSILLLAGCIPLQTSVEKTAQQYVSDRAEKEVAVPRFIEKPVAEDGTELLFAETVYAQIRENGPDADSTEKYQALLEQEARLNSRWVRAALAADADVTDARKQEIYRDLSETVWQFQKIRTELGCLLAKEDRTRSALSPEETERLKCEAVFFSDAAEPWYQRESELLTQYATLSERLTVTANGRTYTAAELQEDAVLSMEDWFSAMERYRAAYSAEASALFTQLVDCRTELAKACGYASYTEYCYALYGFERTPEQSAKLAESVAGILAPVYSVIRTKYAGDLQAFRTADRYETTQTLERTGRLIETELPFLHSAWQAMIRGGYYDASVSQTKRTQHYTAYLTEEKMPYVFWNWDDSADMPAAVLHEFGHFAGYYYGAEARLYGDSVELNELEAQGLELIVLPWYDILYRRRAEEARIAATEQALSVIVWASVWELFLQEVYGTLQTEPDALEQRFRSISEPFDLPLGEVQEQMWLYVPELWSEPFLPMGYGVTMLSALELGLASEQDPAGAIRAYRRLLDRNVRDGYAETVRAMGLHDPMREDTLVCLQQKLEQAMSRWDA